MYYAEVGEPSKAVDRLRRYVYLHGPDIWIAEAPALKPLHGQPAFEALVARIREQIGS